MHLALPDLQLNLAPALHLAGTRRDRFLGINLERINVHKRPGNLAHQNRRLWRTQAAYKIGTIVALGQGRNEGMRGVEIFALPAPTAIGHNGEGNVNVVFGDGAGNVNAIGYFGI